VTYCTRADRVSASVPIDFGLVRGLTSNISESGILFEANASFELGTLIKFTLALDAPSGRLEFHSEGEVVRVEAHHARTRVAVKLLDTAIAAVRI
jgi:hypothetical protein